MTTHRLCLVPDDEQVVAHHRRADDMLRHLRRYEQGDAGPRPLPDSLAGGAALDALTRVWDQVRAALDVDPAAHRDLGQRRRWFAPDRVRLRTPLRAVRIDQADLDVLAAAGLDLLAGVTPTESRHLHLGDAEGFHPAEPDDLAAMLAATPTDLTLWPPQYVRQNAAVVARPLSRLVALLDLAADDDSDLLAEVAGTAPTGGDLVLTEDQDTAHRRFAFRWHYLIHDDETGLNAV